MMQSWGVSRLNGQISKLQAGMEHAGTALAQIRALRQAYDAASVAENPGVGMFDPRYLAKMRMMLWMTAVSSLALLMLILL